MAIFKKKELSDIYAEKKGLGKGEAEELLDDVFATLEEIVVEYATGFTFGNLGKLEVNLVEAKDHNRTNPQTKEKFVQHVEEHYAPKFKLNKGKTSVKTLLSQLDTKQ